MLMNTFYKNRLCKVETKCSQEICSKRWNAKRKFELALQVTPDVPTAF